MIHFKACTRCGGDIDTTYADDSYCIQCSHRPDAELIASLPARPPTVGRSIRLRVPSAAKDRGAREAAAEEPTPHDDPSPKSSCPRCGGLEPVRLDRLRPGDHTCFRCRGCGHIFSPASAEDAERERAG